MHTATYSPEDNKLRLYPECRLDKELYEKVRSMGFIWAPKQELFVAPMWTPSREDFLIGLCGEVGDEDTSLVDRAEERADRFETYSDKRKEEAKQTRDYVNSIAEHIPFGQPILVGHHSEKRARKDAERIENGMRKTVRLWETSEYWKDRAAGAIRHAKYKELPGVRARRIKKLEAEKRKQERYKAEAVRLYKGWQLILTMEGADIVLPETITRETLNKAQILAYSLANGSLYFHALHPTCEEANKKAMEIWRHGFSTYDFLTNDSFAGCPFEKLPPKQVAEIYLSKKADPDRPNSSYNRWIGHYENRLAYEKAMLNEQGGTATDQKRPEVGGACKCWASPKGSFSYIHKVNKVSITVLDNWGNGGGNFSRTIPFDKVFNLMSKSEVDEARNNDMIVERPDKTAFYLKSSADEELKVPDSRYLSPERSEKKEIITEDTEKEEIKAMKETLKQGVKVVSAPQLFPTPPEIAKKMVDYAELNDNCNILEPSAGTGNILTAIGPRYKKTAVEVNEDIAKLAMNVSDTHMIIGDFLQMNGELGEFDRIIMNPPFENASDIKHIKHAIEHLSPGGVLVALCANGPRQNEILKPIMEYWEVLPEGSFKSSGTSVNVAMMVYRKEE